MLVETPSPPFEPGKVRFQRPLLGSEEWVCLADSAIAAGRRVEVVAVEGSFLKVGKLEEVEEMDMTAALPIQPLRERHRHGRPRRRLHHR